MERDEIHVLLIEDDEEDAMLIGEMLAEVEPIRFRLDHVRRLADGLQRLERGGVDVVLLDLGLPDSWGLGSVDSILSQSPDTPVVVLTLLGDEETPLRAVQRGAQDYLVKGEFRGELLARCLRHAIERQRAQETVRAQSDALAAGRERLAAILDALPDAVLVVGEDGVVRFANAAAESLLGGGERGLVGRALDLPLEPGADEVSLPGAPPRRARVRRAALTWDDRPARLVVLTPLEGA